MVPLQSENGAKWYQEISVSPLIDGCFVFLGFPTATQSHNTQRKHGGRFGAWCCPRRFERHSCSSALDAQVLTWGVATTSLDPFANGWKAGRMIGDSCKRSSFYCETIGHIQSWSSVATFQHSTVDCGLWCLPCMELGSWNMSPSPMVVRWSLHWVWSTNCTSRHPRILLVLPGLNNDSRTSFVQATMRHLRSEGFQAVPWITVVLLAHWKRLSLRAQASLGGHTGGRAAHSEGEAKLRTFRPGLFAGRRGCFCDIWKWRREHTF